MWISPLKTIKTMEHWCELADWQCLWPGDWPPHIFLSTQRSTCGTTVDVACVVCFFFKHNMLTQDSNVQMGKWSKHLETVRLTRSFELVFWSMSICVHINVGVWSYHCVLCQSTFLLVEFWFRTKTPYYSCVDRPFLFFSRWHLR